MASNPWLPQSEPAPAPVSVVEQAPPTTGASAPQPGLTAPDQVDRLPVIEHRAPAPLWWVGAHGGAGEWTLSQLVPQWRAAGHAWPQLAGEPDEAMPAVLVARSSVRGLQAAQRAATQWASGSTPSVRLLGLVVIADAPGLMPRPIRDFLKVLGGGVPRVWRVPWVESWRLGQNVTAQGAPREIRKLLKDLTVLLQPVDDGTTTA